MGTLIVVDTTVLVYATGGDHPLRHPARQVIEALGRGDLQGTTSVEVIQEFANVRARRSDRAAAAHLAMEFAALLSPLVTIGEDELTSGLQIWHKTPSLGAFDAVLAAVARNHAATLVSGDKAFAYVAGLDHVPLDDQTVSRLLSG